MQPNDPQVTVPPMNGQPPAESLNIPTRDVDPGTPGIQAAIDVWWVVTGGKTRMAFPIEGRDQQAARDNTFGAYVREYGIAPTIESVQPAQDWMLEAWVNKTADLADGGAVLTGFQRGMLTALTVRGYTPATHLEPPAPTWEPRRWRWIDWNEVRHIFGGLGFLTVWAFFWITPFWVRIVLPFERWMLHALGFSELEEGMRFPSPGVLMEQADGVDLSTVGWIAFSSAVFILTTVVWMVGYWWVTRRAFDAGTHMDPYSPPAPPEPKMYSRTRAGRT